MKPSGVHRLARVQGFRATLGAMATLTCLFGLAACGSEEEERTIPADQGDQILAHLDQLEERVNAGECALAEETALSLQQTIQNLPAEVDGELRETLARASGNLVSQTRDPDQCEEAEEKVKEPEEPIPGATGAEGVLEEEG